MTGASAVMELGLTLPLILAVTVALYDLQEYLRLRGSAAEELGALAEHLAVSPATTPPTPLATTLREFAQHMGRTTRGRVRIRAVVSGNTVNPNDPTFTATAPRLWDDGLAADTEWPAPPGPDTGAGPGCPAPPGTVASPPCPAPLPRIPGLGLAYGASQPVMERECAVGVTPAAWPSRRMERGEWWVVVEGCVAPHPRAFLMGRFFTTAMALFEEERALEWVGFWRGTGLATPTESPCPWCTGLPPAP